MTDAYLRLAFAFDVAALEIFASADMGARLVIARQASTTMIAVYLVKEIQAV